MAIEIGDGVIRINADDSPFWRSLGDLTKRAGMAMTAAGGAIVAGLGVSLKAFAEQQNAIAQLEAVLTSTKGAAGLTSQELQNMASSLQKVTTYGDETIMGAESLMLTFTKVGKDVFPQAMQAVLDMSTAMGQDLKSSVIQVGKALNDPIAGATALRRVGVQLTDQQQEQIKVFMASGDVLSAQKIILQELATEFGGSASAAAATFSGHITQLKNQIGDIMEVIGGALEPILSRVTGILQQAVDHVQRWVGENPQLVATITLVVAGIGALLTAIGPLLIALPFVVSGIAAFLSPAGAVLGALAALAVGVGYLAYQMRDVLYGTFQAAVGWVQANWDQIVRIFQNAASAIASWMRTIAERIQIMWEVISSVFSGAVDGVTSEWDRLDENSDQSTRSILGTMEELSKRTDEWMKRIEDRTKAFHESIRTQYGALIDAGRNLGIAMNEAYSTLLEFTRAFSGDFGRLWQETENTQGAAIGRLIAQIVNFISMIIRLINFINMAILAIARLAQSIMTVGGSEVLRYLARGQGGPIPGYAAGGVIRPVIVGEHGPEVMFAPVGGRIVKHSDAIAALRQTTNNAGDTISITQYISNEVDVERVMVQMRALLLKRSAARGVPLMRPRFGV